MKSTRKKPKTQKVTVPGRSITEKMNRPASGNADDGMELMSKIIIEFAAPLLETCEDAASEKKAISLAVFIWNITLLSEEARKRTLDTYLSECQKVVPSHELQVLSAYIDQLVESRKTRFADNRKKITHCTLGGFGDNRAIEVGYTME